MSLTSSLQSQPYDPPERRPNATKTAIKNKAIGAGAAESNRNDLS
jgi:hypothetical protein